MAAVSERYAQAECRIVVRFCSPGRLLRFVGLLCLSGPSTPNLYSHRVRGLSSTQQQGVAHGCACEFWQYAGNQEKELALWPALRVANKLILRAYFGGPRVTRTLDLRILEALAARFLSQLRTRARGQRGASRSLVGAFGSLVWLRFDYVRRCVLGRSRLPLSTPRRQLVPRLGRREAAARPGHRANIPKGGRGGHGTSAASRCLVQFATILLHDSIKASTARTSLSHSASPMASERLIIPRRASHTPSFSA